MTVTPAEAGKILAAARMIDNRDYDEATAIVWAGVLSEHVTLESGYAAVRDHYGRTAKYLMPAHINDYAAARRQDELDLLQRAGQVDFPNGLSQAQEREYRIAWQGYVKAGGDRQQATRAADAELGYVRGDEIPAPPAVRELISGWTNAHTAR